MEELWWGKNLSWMSTTAWTEFGLEYGINLLPVKRKWKKKLWETFWYDSWEGNSDYGQGTLKCSLLEMYTTDASKRFFNRKPFKVFNWVWILSRTYFLLYLIFWLPFAIARIKCMIVEMTLKQIFHWWNISSLSDCILMKCFKDFVISLCIHLLVRWNCLNKIIWLLKIKD